MEGNFGSRWLWVFFFLLFIFFLWQKSHNGDACVYGFDGCDDFMAVYVFPNSMSCIR